MHRRRTSRHRPPIRSVRELIESAKRGIEVVFVSPRHDVYATYSRRLMDLLRTETPLLEQRSIDEAALDWRHHGFASEPVVRLRQARAQSAEILAPLRTSARFLFQ